MDYFQMTPVLSRFGGIFLCPKFAFPKNGFSGQPRPLLRITGHPYRYWLECTQVEAMCLSLRRLPRARRTAALREHGNSCLPIASELCAGIRELNIFGNLGQQFYQHRKLPGCT